MTRRRKRIRWGSSRRAKRAQWLRDAAALRALNELAYQRIMDAIRDLPCEAPPNGWQQRVLEKIDGPQHFPK